MAGLGIAQATVATLGTVMIIGLGFLPRPSRASLLWALAFVLAMVSTWVTLAGEALGDEPARRAGLGFMLGAPALIWSGLRARGPGVRTFAWVAPVQAIVSAAVLVMIGDSPAYGLVFRVVFFGAAVFAALTLVELSRSPDRHERLVYPIAVVSGAFVVLAAFTLLSGVIFPATGGDLGLVRTLNSLGMLVYLVCATVSLLFFASVSPVGVQRASSWPQFSVTASDRLARARSAGETSWVVLSVRMDDPDDIRVAAGESAFARIVDRFETAVRESFPAEADIGREARGRLVVLMSRPGPVVREHVRVLLRAVTEIDAAQQISVRLSASVGWAAADVVGYDFPVLLAAAQRAAEEASDLGGDRWQRLVT